MVDIRIYVAVVSGRNRLNIMHCISFAVALTSQCLHWEQTMIIADISQIVLNAPKTYWRMGIMYIAYLPYQHLVPERIAQNL